MLTLFRNGGFPMFFILGFGFLALATAFWYALRPDEKVRGFIDYLSKATLYSTLCGTCTDVATVCFAVAQNPMDPEQRTRMILEGLGESLSPGIMGFALLSLIALLVAVGQRRYAARRA